jgi:L-cystine uptake protein TcyP (sodium:dicarboxylate symporter family)
MARTAVNVSSDLTAGVVMEKWQHKDIIQQMDNEVNDVSLKC